MVEEFKVVNSYPVQGSTFSYGNVVRTPSGDVVTINTNRDLSGSSQEDIRKEFVSKYQGTQELIRTIEAEKAAAEIRNAELNRQAELQAAAKLEQQRQAAIKYQETVARQAAEKQLAEERRLQQEQAEKESRERAALLLQEDIKRTKELEAQKKQEAQAILTKQLEEKAQQKDANLDFLARQSAGATNIYDQLVTAPADVATARAKEAEKANIFRTGFEPLDYITGKTVYGSVQLLEAAKGQVGAITGTAAYVSSKQAATKPSGFNIADSPFVKESKFIKENKLFSPLLEQPKQVVKTEEEIQLGAEAAYRGGREAGRLATGILLNVSPTTGLITNIAESAGSSSLEELGYNVAFDVGLGGLQIAGPKASGFLKDITIGTPKISKTFDVASDITSKAIPLYFTGTAISTGTEAITQAAAGNVELAEELDRQFTRGLATSKFGDVVGGKIASTVIAAPKALYTTGTTIKQKGLSSLLDPMVRQDIKASTDVGFLDLTAPRYEFKKSVGTPEQIAAIEAGEKVPLPQERGIQKLISEAETGKAAKFAKETFVESFDPSKPIVYRSSEYGLPKGEVPKLFSYEEPGIYTGPALSTIGLKDIATQGESTSTKLSLFPAKDTGRGKALIIQPETIKTLPTTKTFANVTAKDVIALRKTTGVDLAALGEAQFTVKQKGKVKIAAGESILGTEISKITVGKGRPLKGRDIQMSITGEKFVKEVSPELMKAIDYSKTEPGAATLSIPYTLGRGGEAEFLIRPTKGTYVEPVSLVKRGKIREKLQRPEAFFTLDGKAVPIEGYLVKRKGDIDLGIVPKEDFGVVKKDIDITKAYKDIVTERTTRLERTKYVPLITTKFGSQYVTTTKKEPITYTELPPTILSIPNYSYSEYIGPTTSIIRTPSTSITTPTPSSYTLPKITTTYSVPTTTTDIYPNITSDILPPSTSIKIPEPTTSILPTITSDILPPPTTSIIPTITSDILPPPATSIIPTITSDIIPPITSDIIPPPTSTRMPTSTTTPRKTTTTRITTTTTTKIPSITTTTIPTTRRPPYKRATRDIFEPSYKGKAYDVYVRKGEKGQKIKDTLVQKGLPYGAALNLGLTTAATYSQRTTILKPSKTQSNVPDELVNKQLLGEFRPLRPKTKIKKGKRDLAFVEKSKYAINTPQEKAGIPYRAQELRKAGLLNYKAPKRSKKGFWGMRI